VTSQRCCCSHRIPYISSLKSCYCTSLPFSVEIISIHPRSTVHYSATRYCNIVSKSCSSRFCDDLTKVERNMDKSFQVQLEEEKAAQDRTGWRQEWSVAYAIQRQRRGISQVNKLTKACRYCAQIGLIMRACNQLNDSRKSAGSCEIALKPKLKIVVVNSPPCCGELDTVPV